MSYKVIGKYIRELRFNIPNAKVFFMLSKDIANYKINIDIKSIQIKQNVIEVSTSLNLIPKEKKSDQLDTKIVFATIIELLNEKLRKEEIEKIVLVEVPSEIYSELRKIFVGLFESSGFKDIKISQNVDFQKLYSLRKVQ